MDPSALDLTTVAAVQGWLNIQGTQDIGPIQGIISSLSVYWMWRTGRGMTNGDVPSQSPYVTPIAYSEFYDGNGNFILYLRQYPVRSVQLLSINGIAVPASNGNFGSGYVIDGSGKALAFANAGSGAGMSYGIGFGLPYNYRYAPLYKFAQGIQNINVQYTAGYNGIPFDVTDTVTHMAAIIYKRRDSRYFDMKQNFKSEAGTVTFQDWEWPPEILATINHYTRIATV